MIQTFQFRLLPNKGQAVALTRILEDNCETYNAALQERRDAWKLQRKVITYRDQQNELSELRKDPEFAWVASWIQRDAIRRVDLAFKAFFRRCKAKENPGYPRFKSRQSYDSFSFFLPTVKDKSVNVPKLGWVKMRGGRSIMGEAKLVTVKRDGRRWNVCVACDVGPAPSKVTVITHIGIDAGLTSLATLSNGQKVENPRWARKHEARIAAANRRLALKQKRSKNRLRAREVLRRAHQRAANARKNYLHHQSKWLVQNFDQVSFEDLKIRGLVQKGLAKSIMDAAWGILLWQISYKAESAGRWAVAVNPRGTTQRCSGCGKIVHKALWDRVHSCGCGLVLDRDVNAAINIDALGMSVAGHSPSKHTIV